MNKIPYKKIRSMGKPAITNLKTGKITRFGSIKKRESGLRFRRALEHGFKPTGKIRVPEHKRKGRTVRKHPRKRKR